jgi:hypothetical protein
MFRHPIAFLLVIFQLTFAAFGQSGPANGTVLIIRHAEKPDDGPSLSLIGDRRARAYAQYFTKLTIGGKAAHLDAIFATADSAKSHRPRLTMGPLVKATKLPADYSFESEQVGALAAKVRATMAGKTVLVCWHHGSVPELLAAFGAKPDVLLPQAQWPDEVYDWLILLRYDQKGRLIPAESRRIHERLLPGDSK